MSTDNDIYSTIGACVELLATSKYHRQFPLVNCLQTLILPAIKHKQIKLYYSDNQKVQALVTWAWLSEEQLERICLPEGGGAMLDEQWNCGSILYFSDLIAPFGNGRKVFFDLVNNEFPKVSKAVSVRRNIDGTVRKKNVWIRK